MFSRLHHISDDLKNHLSKLRIEDQTSNLQSNKIVEDGYLFLTNITNEKAKIRANFVILMAYGYNVSEIKKFCKASVATLYLWYRKVTKYGFPILIAKKQPGKKPSLDKDQKRHLQEIVKQDSTLFGYPIWTGQALVSYIEKSFGVSLKIRRGQYLLKELKEKLS